MKYASKKVFILENGSYRELSYDEFCILKEADATYADKFFIPLHGMLMEVTAEVYREFYKSQRRQKYINERSAINGNFSYDMLTTDDFNGEEILIDNSEDIATEVVHIHQKFLKRKLLIQCTNKRFKFVWYYAGYI